jgi:hypothetical protein
MLPLLATLALAVARPDSVSLTQLRIVIDSAMFRDVGRSTFLPEGYGAGYLAGPAEVRLCDRLTCVVFVPPDSAAGLAVGDVRIGVRPVAGSALADRLAGQRADVAIVDLPPAPDDALDLEHLPTMYYLEAATIALPLEAIPEVDRLLRSAGATVYGEGQGLVVQFPSQRLRVVPAFGGTGPKELTFRLRREIAGDPTYRFGTRSRLKVGPGRRASWSF